MRLEPVSNTISPAWEPLSVAEAARHLRIANPTADEENDLADFITAVRQRAESAEGARLAIVDQNWNWFLDYDWPAQAYCDGRIAVPISPFRSVESIVYVDANGDEQTWFISPNVYYTVQPSSARTRRGAIALGYNQQWPVPRYQPDAIRIEIVAGFDAAEAVPPILKKAMLLDLGSLWENRVAVLAGGASYQNALEVPMTSRAIYRAWRAW